MSEQVSKQKTDASGRLAVVGDRELVIGYRLIGIDDTFIVSDEEDASKKIQELYSSGEFGLIIASNSMRAKLSSKFVAEIEESIEPLVLFMPSQKETAAEEEETIADLAKRVLELIICYWMAKRLGQVLQVWWCMLELVFVAICRS